MSQFAIPNADPVATLTFEDVVTVDISTFGANDYISLSLPEFAKTKFTLSQTFIDFTSHEKGNFGVGPTDSLAFSAGTFVNTQGNNDTELRFAIGALTHIDKSAITGVRFRLLPKENTTFRCLAIRACATSWQYAPIDLNTLWHRVVRPPSPNGTANPVAMVNLVTNPSIETATTGYSARGTGNTAVKSEEAARWGKYGLEVKVTGTSESGVQTPVAEVSPSTTYAVSTYVLIPEGKKATINFQQLNASFVMVNNQVAIVGTGEWQRVEKIITGIAETVKMRIYVETFSEVMTFWVDGYQVVQSTVPVPYFDGDNGGEWEGTSNASKSKTAYTFPIEKGEPFPSVFRSNRLTGFSDPEPVNLSVGALFTTGTLSKAAGTNKNELALYFRDIPTDNQTMIEMDTRSMAFLDTQDKQPDYGRALFNTRNQEELDLLSQSEIDGRTQYNLERKRDESEHTWMSVRLKWGEETASNKLEFRDADGLGYSWSGMTLEKSIATELDKGKYLLVVTIKDNYMEAKIYQANQIGQITQTPIFESGRIIDDNIMKRRKGRFGWFANLRDGDAHIDNIKSRGTNYGEMISKPYRSITPVKGAQIFAGSTSDHQLIEGFERTQPEYMSLTIDPAASATGNAIRVDTSPLKPLQGISTNTFMIDSPKNIRISFDIKFPDSEIPGGGLIGFILGANETTYTINLSTFTFNVWSHVSVNLPEEVFQTGAYKLVLMQTLPVAATSWWVENLAAKTYSVKWSARPNQTDPWGIEPAEWLEAGNTLNEANGGIVFPTTGANLQVRAQALRQDAEISEFRVVPQYATLGNIVFKN